SYMTPKPVAPYTFKKEADISSPIEATVLGPDAEYLNIAFRFPGASTKEAMMLDFMSSVLSNGNAGLMDLNLVKQQKVLSASAGAYCLKDYSVLFIDGKAKEGQKLEEVKALILDQIKLLKDGKFDNDMLLAIINNYKKSLIQQRESNSGRAFGLLEAFTADVAWDQKILQLNEMSKLTKSDIQEFAKKWLNNNYVCIYKRIGKEENVVKVDKPAITPVAMNRDKQSEFVSKVSSASVKAIEPVFVNYEQDIDKAEVKTTTNKVRLLGVKNKTNELFTQYYYLKLGSWNNKLFPLAMDYLQYLGTDKYTADQVSQKFYTLACDFGVSAGSEESYVYLNGLQQNYKEALSLFEHVLANCKPDQEALNNMIANEKKKRSDSKLNKNLIRSGLRYYAQFGSKNPFNNELSNAELDQLKASDLISILHSLTSYPHMVLYYGPADLSNISTQLASLHTLPKTFNTIPAAQSFPYLQQQQNQVLFADYDMVQAEVQWVRNSDVFNPEQVPVVNMFNEYFGGNMSGIVFQEIRESKALAYSTFAGYSTPQKASDPFVMSAYVGCQADKMKEAISGMQELLDALPASEKLFHNSAVSMKSTMSTSRTIKTGILFSYLNAMKRGLSYDMNEKVYKSIDAFSLKDIQDFHKNKIAQKPYTLTVVGSEAKVNWDVLNKFGPVKKINLDEIFGY
ncbi:MAG: insulinase family protein, partial [Chitinophagaceae bacterium]|nr:insulinase family protein [Chitinophagaceae bacterium]